MALDMPGFGSALWSLYDSTGIRPEYALVSMALESNLNPQAVNSINCQGLNQMCAGSHTLPSGYASYSASQQVNQVIAPFWKNLVATYGPIRSGTRLEQANWLPGTLPKAKALGDVVYKFASPNADSPVFDPTGKGYATVQDIANALQKKVAGIQGILAQVYALRPGETPRDPVYGTDFGGAGGGPSWFDIAAVLGATSVAVVTVGVAVRHGYLRW